MRTRILIASLVLAATAACQKKIEPPTAVCDADHPCVDGVPIEHCTNNVLDGDEAQVDCGGSCNACPGGGHCTDSADCPSGMCDPTTQACVCANAGQCGSGVCFNNNCQEPVCNDGVMNGNETGLDCGGGCSLCIMCTSGGECPSGVCGSGGSCAQPRCDDQIQNGTETGVDCGGTCAACGGGGGGGCSMPGDCTSGVCGPGNVCTSPPCQCQAATCTDGVKNGTETDTDCGGGCVGQSPLCEVNEYCTAGTDCIYGSCGVGNSCATPPCQCQAAACTDGVKNGSETDTDCGGSCVGTSPLCDVNELCTAGTDCVFGSCGTNNVCATPPCQCQDPACTDGVKNGSETDTDCGGSCVGTSPLCDVNELCTAGTDCIYGSCGVDNVCGSPPCQCQNPACTDGVKNGSETDTDCGGSCVGQSPLCEIGEG